MKLNKFYYEIKQNISDYLNNIEIFNIVVPFFLFYKGFNNTNKNNKNIRLVLYA